MSASLIKAHGGSKNLVTTNGEIVNTGLFVTNTLAGKVKNTPMKYGNYLVSTTHGIPQDGTVMKGVLDTTMQGLPHSESKQVEKVYNKGKTQPKTYGQVPYAGKNY